MAALKDRLADAAYGLGWSVVYRVPESWPRWVFMRGADLAWRRQGPRVQVLEDNLRRVIGPAPSGQDLRALSRAAMLSYARYWFEVFRLPAISTERILASTLSVGAEDVLHASMAAGRGVVVALPHMGNYEEAGAWIIARGAGKFTTVAERLRPESLYRRFVEFREGLGFEALPATVATAGLGSWPSGCAPAAGLPGRRP